MDVTNPFSAYCEEMLSSLVRSDQRRCGTDYIRGLLDASGRKNVRGIAAHGTHGDANQSLHRFIDRSPWKNTDVRQRLASRLAGRCEVHAWVAEEVAFPKSGRSSVGVARQYAEQRRRLLNCQLALAMFLVTGDQACPVDWRLMLPSEWDASPARRSRARVPVTARSQPRWQHLLNIVDEMLIDWRLPAAPIVARATDLAGAIALVQGLADRRVPYLVSLPNQTPVRIPAPLSMVPQQDSDLSVGQLAMAFNGRGGGARTWHTRGAGPSLVLATRFSPLGSVNSRTMPPGMYLTAELSPGRATPVRMWVTNLARRSLPGLLDLASAQQRSAEGLSRLVDDLGLSHFEGRSFPGWHHHVTLVSLARGYQILSDDDQLPLRPAHCREPGRQSSPSAKAGRRSLSSTTRVPAIPSPAP